MSIYEDSKHCLPSLGVAPRSERLAQWRRFDNAARPSSAEYVLRKSMIKTDIFPRYLFQDSVTDTVPYFVVAAATQISQKYQFQSSASGLFSNSSTNIFLSSTIIGLSQLTKWRTPPLPPPYCFKHYRQQAHFSAIVSQAHFMLRRTYLFFCIQHSIKEV